MSMPAWISSLSGEGHQAEHKEKEFCKNKRRQRKGEVRKNIERIVNNFKREYEEGGSEKLRRGAKTQVSRIQKWELYKGNEKQREKRFCYILNYIFNSIILNGRAGSEGNEQRKIQGCNTRRSAICGGR